MTPVTILDRHIGRSIFVSTLLVLGVLLAVLTFVTLVDALSDFGKGSFGLYALVRYVVLSQPAKLYEVLPVAVLIGTIMGLSTLALNSELVAMRASGVSVTRIVLSAIKAGLIFVVAGVIAGELVIPVSETAAQAGRAAALATALRQKDAGLWLRDGPAFVNIGEVLPDLSMMRVNIYQFDGGSRLRSQIFAERARIKSHGWQLEEVRQSRFFDNRIGTHAARTARWESTLTPEVIAAFAVKPEALSLVQLNRYIQHLQRNNQDTGRYRLSFWQKLFMPLAAATMILLATPFVFRQVRTGGMAQRIFVGVMLGLAFVVANRSFGYLGLIYGVPPLAGALLPMSLFLVAALYLLRRVV